MTPDMYEAAAVAIRQCRTTLDRYAAELSETEAALRQMKDDPRQTARRDIGARSSVSSI
jgi:hypothetical protein